MNKIKNTIKGGVAIPLNKKYYLMRGRTHEQGGIKLGNNVEVENGEILKIEPNQIKVLSNANILGNTTPAEYALGGLPNGTLEERFNQGFKFQEKFKKINRLNDDGTKAKYGCKKKYNLGGEEEPYNIFTDPKSYAARDAHRKSLEAFVKANPEIKKLNTADFIDFFSQLAGLESSYNAIAGKGKGTDGQDMTYSGYYGLKGGLNYSANDQHKKAYEHLAFILNNQMVQEDLARGIELGYTPAQILAKYWNQGNRVTKFLHRGIDDKDGLGTNISDYGWNVTADVDYSNHLNPALTDDFIIVGEADGTNTLSDISNRVRNENIKYGDKLNYIIDLNKLLTKGEKKEFNPNMIHKGDTIYVNHVLDREYNRKMRRFGGRVKASNNSSTGKKIKAYLGLYLKAHPNTIGNIVSSGSQLLASGLSWGLNRNMLNNMEYVPVPKMLQPVKYKTDVNIQPQINELKRSVKRYNDFVNKNTASSQVAYGRNLLSNDNYLTQYNKLTSAAQQQEDALINQDIAQQQETAKYNLEQYNKWLAGKYDFKNNIRNLQSENNTALLQNVSSGVLDFFDKQAQYDKDMLNAIGLMAGNPNVTPEYLAEKGMPQFKTYLDWMNTSNANREIRKQNRDARIEARKQNREFRRQKNNIISALQEGDPTGIIDYSKLFQ